jgi:hypothetical protein
MATRERRSFGLKALACVGMRASRISRRAGFLMTVVCARRGPVSRGERGEAEKGDNLCTKI